MGLFDFFRRSKSGDSVPDVLSKLHTKITSAGLLLSFENDHSLDTVEALLEAGSAASSQEKILRTYLANLFMEGQCQLSPEGVVIAWSQFYQLMGDPEHQGLINLLDAPAITSAVPILGKMGTVSDRDFQVHVTGWIENGQKVHVEQGVLPEVKLRGQSALLSAPVYTLLKSLEKYFATPKKPASQHENELAWGELRFLAIKAGALFGDKYLKETVVLTPQSLRLLTHREAGIAEPVYTIEPTFDDAPSGWLERFDGYQTVQEHYDILDQGRRIRVILAEPVRNVLQVVKKEMPGRKISGSKAERFIHNPIAYLGDIAEGVIEPHSQEAATDEFSPAQVTTFHLEAVTQNGVIIHALLNLNIFYSDSMSSFEEPVENLEELYKLVQMIQKGLDQQRLKVPFREFDLSLDANAEVELAHMRNLLHTWQSQANAVIRFEDVYELTGYSDRIEGIGVAKPIYVPVLQKDNNDDEGQGVWVPENLTPMLKVFLNDQADPVLVPLTEEWVQQYDQKVSDAEQLQHAVVHDAALPTGLETRQARDLVERFKSLLQVPLPHLLTAEQEPADAENEDSISTEKKSSKNAHGHKETLLIKTNFNTQDYIQDRKELLTPPVDLEPRLPKALLPRIKLKKHQRYGVAWFQHLYSLGPSRVRGCLLADDMGLGKTLQLLNVLGQAYEDDPQAPPSLILVPKSLLQNWDNEIGKFFNPSYPSHLVLYGHELSARKQPKSRIEQELHNRGVADLLVPGWIGAHKIIITTYDVLTGFEFSFAKIEFNFVICDEAQRIKNPAARVSMAVRALKARFRVACTGTPVENSLVDLWCLFDFFQPGLLGTLDDFYKTYRKPIECKTEEQRQALARLQGLIRPQTLRRTKQDISEELPKKIFAVNDQYARERVMKSSLEKNDLLKIGMVDYQRAQYKRGLERLQKARAEQDGQRRGKLSFAALHFMKAVCAEPYCLPGEKFITDPQGWIVHLKNSPKMAWLLDELELIKSKSEKAIVFTEIREIQMALSLALQERFNLKPAVVNGDSENRQSYIDAFSEKSGFNVIILSPLAAGAGLNVVAANHVIHFTRTWNPAKEAQATDRAYRIGQERDVVVYCPTVVDLDDPSYMTFEQRLDLLLKEKQALASRTIDGDDLSEMLNGSMGEVGFTEFMTASGPSTPFTVAPRLLTIEDVDRLNGEAFEYFVMLLVSKQGYNSKVTEKSNGDGGIDVVGLNSDGNGVLAQCKSSQSVSLGWDAVKEVVAGAARYQSQYPNARFEKWAITNQKFNPNATHQAQLNHVKLIQREDIEKMLKEIKITDFDLDEILSSLG